MAKKHYWAWKRKKGEDKDYFDYMGDVLETEDANECRVFFATALFDKKVEAMRWHQHFNGKGDVFELVKVSIRKEK